MWFDEKVDKLKRGNWLYKMMCHLCFRAKRKFSYKELYLILVKINEKEIGIDEAKKKALNKILEFYKDSHDGKLPEGLGNDDK
jgi:hypothetical protein